MYNGDAYGLLKSNIYQAEAQHIAPSNQFTPDGHRIFLNTSDHTAHHDEFPGCEPGKDLIGLEDPTKQWGGCFGIPNDEIIYVCSDTVEQCNKMVNPNAMPFNVYFRLKDGQVPYEIANYCPKPKLAVSETQQQVLILPTPSGTANLQLETFTVGQKKSVDKWLGAWCKPADYFYPKEKTDIHFDVKPQGPFTYTLPKYQTGGWDFTAFPDGNVVYQGENYPYIYWDAAIPNNLINIPQKGYSVKYGDLGNFLNTLLPKLGLNQNETKGFEDYWTNYLPQSKYYFVGVIPQAQVENLAPLTISPAPDSLLRVTLYFKPLDAMTNVAAPQIDTFTRKGFTVVEWGAIFDTQKHPGFSCMM